MTAHEPLPTATTFEAVFHAEYAAMVALAAAVSGSRRDAEDIAQEAMSRLERNWPRIGRYDKPGAWLRRVTINLALSQRRRLGREAKAMLGLAERQTALVPEPPDEDAPVWAAVRTLPGKQRAVLSLQALEGMTTSEIAQVLDIAEPTVRVHLHRARAAVKAALNDRKDRP